MKVLVVEDDPTLGQYLKRGLEEQRYTVDLVADGETGEQLAIGTPYDVIVLDLRLPGRSGLEVLRTWRGRGMERPVLVLTAQDAVDLKVQALRAGADDYVTKPFGKQELLARIRAVMRRLEGAEAPGGGLRVGSLVLDAGRHEASVDGNVLALTRTEFALLAALAAARGRVVPHDRLLAAGWPTDPDPDPQWLKPHLARLRAKLEEAGAPLPTSVRGVGYRLEAPAE